MANKLFVGNVEWGTTEDQLQELFSQHWNVEDVFIPKDKFTGRPKGFAFVTFATDEEAAGALEKLNGFELNGRPIVVNEARPPREDRGPRPE